MAVTTGWFGNGLLRLANGNIDLDTNSLKVALIDDTYDPVANADSLILWDPAGNGTQDPKASEVSGTTNYTAGGQALTSVNVDLRQDTDMTAWAADTTYDVGDLVRPVSANGYIYRCIASAGQSGSTEPATWPTVKGEDEVDNNVTWENLGTSFVRFDFANPLWSSSTITGAGAAIVYVDGTAGSSDYVIGYIDFGGTETSTNGNFEIVIPTEGMLQLATS